MTRYIDRGQVIGHSPGQHENFASVGTVGGRWTQASDITPDGFVPFKVETPGRLTVLDYVENTFDYDGPGPQPVSLVFDVAHSVIATSCGSEDGEVSIVWDASAYPVDIAHQVGPAICLDLEAEDDTQLGFTMNGDLSLGLTCYVQNVPRAVPMSEIFDYTNGLYDVLEGTIVTNASHLLYQGVHRLTMRKVGNQFAGYWNGVRLGAVQTLPAWAEGRDGWGIHCVGIKSNPIHGVGFENDYPNIRDWHWRPYSGPL